ncbi:MAG: hypothetical protein ACR5LD_01890 [Symbiopectobacterium sp.]
MQNDSRPDNYLVASTKAFNPSRALDSETELPRLMAKVKTCVRIQVMVYAPLSYGPNHTRPLLCGDG